MPKIADIEDTPNPNAKSGGDPLAMR